MNITVLFFGITSDLVGSNTLPMEVSNECSVQTLKNDLIKKYPALKNLNEFAIAVNEEYASNEHSLKNADIVAIIPPVSGG